MKQSVFILFVSFVILIYSLVNYYLFIKGYKSLPDKIIFQYSYVCIYLFFSMQFVISRIILLSDITFQSKFISEIGGIWFAAVLYFLIIALFINLLEFSDKFFHFLPDFGIFKFKILLSIIGLVFCLLIIGFINARTPRIKALNLEINKKSALGNLKIAMVSDVHFGTIIGYMEIKKMLEKIEKEKPDIFFIVGDLTDEGVTKEFVNKIKPLFDNFQPRYGKFAILGNHEYLNKIERTLPIFHQLNITLIRDSVINFVDEFVVLGRDDKSKLSAL